MEITQYKFIKELPDTIKSQLVSFGYIEETKPEEKPTYWYIETSEMKKSEYWEVFKEWFCPDDSLSYLWKFYGRRGGSFLATDYIKGQYEYLLSPDEWYKNIYKPDNDKAIDIPELMEDDTLEMIREREEYDKSIMEEIPEVPSFFSSELSKEHNEWNHKVRDTLNLITKKINNL